MTELWVALAGVLIVGGGWGVVLGLRPVPVAARPVGRWRAVTGRGSRRGWWLAGAGLLVGVLVGLLTGWALAVVVVPAAAVGLPVLLQAPQERRVIERLEGLAEWTRNLSGVISAGASLERALSETAGGAPAAIRGEVTGLVARLRSKWSTREALEVFADEVNDPAGDMVAATLILASRARADGVAQILFGLAETVAAEVASRRELEAERAKPRQNARVITIVVTAALGFLAVSGPFLAAYKTPAGQLILGGLLAAYAGCLLLLRKMAQVKPLPRFLTATDRSRS